MIDLLVIVGPTGAGKTDLALRIAEHVSGEILSADSQQVYRSMDIGTGKATPADRARVPHHLLDVIEPDEEMTAARFVELADQAIADLRAREVPIIVAGGTMLYVRALLRGLFEGPAADPAIRAELSERAATRGSSALWHDLQAVDPLSAERIHDTDERRLIRALEVYQLTGLALSEHHRRHQAQPPRYQARWIGLQPERSVLYQRIDARVESMMARGWLAEVQALRDAGFGPELRSQQAIGYSELHQHLLGLRELPDAVEQIQRNSRRYARRQLSWYRGNHELRWFEEPSVVDLDELGSYLLGSKR